MAYKLFNVKFSLNRPSKSGSHGSQVLTLTVVIRVF